MKFNNIIWILIIFILLYFVFKTIDILSSQGYVMECFTNGTTPDTSKISHNVNLPLTTTTSCQNFCSPTSKCAISGQQCLTDNDCPGCQHSSSYEKNTQDTTIPINNNSGNLTGDITITTPQYSTLTSGYGTQQAVITDSLYGKPLQAQFGVDTWKSDFDEDNSLFTKRYKRDVSQYMPNYPLMHSLTGEFLSDGPLPANY